MFGRPVLALAIILPLMAVAGQGQAAGLAKEPGTGSTEIEAKLSRDYIAVPRLHMAVQVDANRKYRSLELEVWLLQPDPAKRQILNSKRKLIAAQMNEDFSAFDWEAFEDSDGGPRVAKQIVAASVEAVSGVKVEDVLIKTLILK